MGGLGVWVDLVDVFDFGFEEEWGGGELGTESVDDVIGCVLDGGDGVRGPEEVEERGEGRAGTLLARAAATSHVAALERVHEVGDNC